MGIFTKEKCVYCGKELGAFGRHSTDVGTACKSCYEVVVKEKLKGKIDKLPDVVKNHLINKNFLDELDNIAKLDLQPVENPGILLQPNEVCYYRGPAQAYRDKFVTTGHTRTGAGISVRVAKNVSVHTGGGISKSIRENVGEFYDGTFIMTNKRFVLLAPKLGFDIPFKKLTSIQNFRNEGVTFYVGTKAYTVITKEGKKIWEIAKHVEIQDDDLPPGLKEELDNTTKSVDSKAKDKTTKSGAAQSREFKALVDDGIITQEEVEVEKKQFLGLSRRHIFMKTVFNIIYWMASVMFIILGLASEGQLISGAISLMVGIIINPLFYKFLSGKLELRGRKYKFRHYVMISMALCIINILIWPSDAVETDNSVSGEVQAEGVEKNSESVKVCTYNDVLNNFIILYNDISDNKIESVEDPSAYGDEVTGTTKISGFTVTLYTREKDSRVEDNTIFSVTIDAEDITRDEADEMKIVFLDFYKTLCGKNGSELWNTISDKFDDAAYIGDAMKSDGNMYWECSKVIGSDSEHRDYSISLSSELQYIPDLEY